MDDPYVGEQLLELMCELTTAVRRGVQVVGCLAALLVVLFILTLAGMTWLVLFLLGASGMLQ